MRALKHFPCTLETFRRKSPIVISWTPLLVLVNLCRSEFRDPAEQVKGMHSSILLIMKILKKCLRRLLFCGTGRSSFSLGDFPQTDRISILKWVPRLCFFVSLKTTIPDQA